jgi:two-component system heavy metal sensor histidine kinase CusS
MNLSFKNRIAFYYMLATATVIAIVFCIIYFVVQTAVYHELDSDLAYEAHKHTKEIKLVNDSIIFINKAEWEEREHREVQVNPVFIQIVNDVGQLMDKSPNLKERFLMFDANKKTDTHFDTRLNEKTIRQVQIPIEQNGVLKGYILTAISQEAAIFVLRSLKNTLLLLFPIVLSGLFFITRFLAGRSIIPVQNITQKADSITRNNLNERIDLPLNKDEIYSLTSSINELLDRIQKAMEREKQFTADASHQLRTPLAVLKGTLEVLVRKPRTASEYKEKINFSIKEIDRISEIVNQLLTLARFNKSDQSVSIREIDLHIAIDDVLHRFKEPLNNNNLSVDLKATKPAIITSDPYYVDLILENIISNAVKYSHQGGKIEIAILPKGKRMVCIIRDNGPGIKSENLNDIFLPFFRSDELAHKDIRGNGLGLSIVKKASEMIHSEVNVESQINKGTRFTISFPIDLKQILRIT